jgi:hypothetical protein
VKCVLFPSPYPHFVHGGHREQRVPDQRHGRPRDFTDFLGFHYPIETYLDRVIGLLAPGGSVIMDVRKGVNGVDLLKTVFNTVSVIRDENKFQRIVAVK